MGIKEWPITVAMQIVVLSLLPAMASAQVYKCVEDGRVSYSSTPCVTGEVPYDSKRASVSDSTASSVTVARDASGVYFLPGTINGMSVKFVVDTGASMTSISGDFARQLGISTCEKAGVTHTANGDTPSCIVKVASLSFGGFNYSDLNVSLNPNMQGVALLGNDLLSGFKVSQQGGVMVLSK